MPPNSRINNEEKNKPCFHCYRKGHSKHVSCVNHGIVSCTSCFRVNVFSNKCNCKHPKRKQPSQILRIVGNDKFHKWYTDLELHDQNIPARLNPFINRSRINHQLATWWNYKQNKPNAKHDEIITIKIIKKGVHLKLLCDVVDSKEYIELGMDYMIQSGYSFTMEGITINSGLSPVLSSPFEKEFVYNLPTIGDDLRNYLQTKKFFLKRGRIVTPCLNSSDIRITVRRRSQSISSMNS